MATITTTLTVGFTNDANTSEGSILRAEIDNRDDGLNGGKTSFAPGDPVGFLVFHSSNVTIRESIASNGSIGSAGNTGVFPVGHESDASRKQFIAFDYDNQEQSLSYPVLDSLQYSWLGNSLSSVQLVKNGTALRINTDNPDAVGLLDVRYNARFQAYRLNGVSLLIPQVFIKIWGEHP